MAYQDSDTGLPPVASPDTSTDFASNASTPASTPESTPTPEFAPTPAPTPEFTPTPAPTPTTFASEPAPADLPPLAAGGPPPAAAIPPSAPEQPAPPAPGLPPLAQAVAPAQKKGARKKLIAILGAVGALILVVVAVFVIMGFMRSNAYQSALTQMEDGNYQEAKEAFLELGNYEDSAVKAQECQDNIDYLAAQALLDAGDFQSAKAAFEALGGFKDAVDQATFCQQNMDFIAAQGTYDAGDVAGAREVFAALSSQGFIAADEWLNKVDYALADQLLTDGKNYEAYRAFQALDDYEDAAERAESCKVAYPGTGIIWQDSAWYSGDCSIVFDCTNLSAARYFKIMSGDSLVATLFVNGGGSVEVEVPAGWYTVKQASGADWFGTEDLFGEDGSYSHMTFTGDETALEVPYNRIITITMNVSDDYSGEAVGSSNERYEEF
jgi:tetratricopeptide (TPR) repeat protein